MRTTHQFVCDGPARYGAALEMEVRAEVKAEYAEQLAVASFWRRLQLRWAMSREVVRRVEEAICAESLY
ncbi:MAG: hypothetical protein SH868_01425 [Bythopirellula sp.]|nr:hypothetical protein [Bythopirellula sp.]